MTMRRNSIARAVALVVVGALAAVLPVGTGIAGAAEAKPRVVTIGVIAPLDAGLTSFGQGIRDSVELAVEQANEADAIPGWTIQVRALDDSSDPVKGVRAAKKLAADPTVVAVVGPYNSGVAEKVLPVLAASDIALVSPSNTLTSLIAGRRPEQAAAAVPELLPPRRSRLAAGRLPRRAGTRCRLRDRRDRQ